MKSNVPIFLTMLMIMVACGAMIFINKAAPKTTDSPQNITQNVEQNTEQNTTEIRHENLFTGEQTEKVSSNTATGIITSVEDTSVTYEYIVDGQTYTGQFKVDIKGFKASAVYSVGDHISVEYAPEKPSIVKKII